MERKIIYLDNAATSFPKHPEVLRQMVEYYTRMGVSPGRGSYDLSTEVAELVFLTRQKVANFFGSSDPNRVIFTANATDALNLAIQGLIEKGDHVVATRLEHNSVLRPLHHLKKQGLIEYDLVGFNKSGQVDLGEIEKSIRPNTRLVIISHASNVLGTVQPVEKIGGICQKKGIVLLLDAAQSAGYIPIKMNTWGVGGVAFTGHKALLGPSGIGGLVLSPKLNIKTIRFGGTGFDSISLYHPQEFPYRLEAGTLNTLGIMGLRAALEYTEKEGARSLQRQMALIQHLDKGLRSLQGITLHSPPPHGLNSVPVLTCTVEGLSSGDAGDILDGDYGIAVRTGIHCAPLVHHDLGTLAKGAIRFSPGPFNSVEDIDKALAAMGDIRNVEYL